MVRARWHLHAVLLLIAADITTSSIPNNATDDVDNDLKITETRRKSRKQKAVSTSSETGGERSSEGSDDMSLGLSSESSSSSSESKRRFKPKSTEDRKGWRKWHRKCPPCPEDMMKKWRDRSIKWICGAYQRARRSFKSECMMHYRNCQDGTMFVKIRDHRCPNDTGTDLPHGFHFFYEYGRDSQVSNSMSSDSSRHLSSGSL